MRNCEGKYLVRLSVLVGRRESLQLPPTNFLEPGMEMVTNSHGSQVTIDGDNANLNTRKFLPPIKLELERIETWRQCQCFFIILLQSYFYN